MKPKSAKPAKKHPRRRKLPLDSSLQFERLLESGSVITHYSLRLYVTGNTARSSQAVANIRSLCEEYLKGRYDLEVVDIYQQPGAALDQQIIAAPTLIKNAPVPPKRVVGNLADRAKILVALDLKERRTGKKE